MDHEARVQVLGRALSARVEAIHRGRALAHAWESRLLQWCMQDPCLKTQILRFVDVLPVLTTPREVVQHLKEYFPHPAHRLPLSLRMGLAVSTPSLLTARAVAAATRATVHRIARLFIASSDLADARPALARLARLKMTVTLDPLGEAVTSQAEADAYLQRCVSLMETLAREPIQANPSVHLSIKPSSLDPHLDPIAPARSAASIARRLGPLLTTAQRLGAFVTLDAEQFQTRDLVLQILQEFVDSAFPRLDGFGVVVQAYLKDAAQVTDRLLAWAERRQVPFTIRLVKGAYWDTEVILARQRGLPLPVFLNKAQTDAMFERLTDRLLKAHRLIVPAIATHNLRSLACAIATAESLGLNTRQWECQLLYGMGEAIQEALVELGVPVRVYTPIGELIPGMAYLVRRLLENTANESFLRHQMTHDRPIEELLQPPVIGTADQPPTPPVGFHNEPETDFARPEARAAWASALRVARQHPGDRHPLVIGRSTVTTDRWMIRRNPSHPQEIVGAVSRAELPHVERAVSAAWEAFPAWSRHPAAERAAILRRIAELTRQRREELAAWEILEVGKPWREADADVAEAIDHLEYYAAECERLDAPQSLLSPPGERNVTRTQPLGVGAVIAPWNFPLGILVGMTSASIVTGNTVVVKPAEQSSVVAARWISLLSQAGLPPGVVNFLPGIGEEVGEALVKHPAVRFIAFTGSKAVGLRIAAAAARLNPGQTWVKRVIAEMGGKNAILVDADADLDEAVRGVVASAFGYQGQKCSACSRVIIVGTATDRFLERLVEATRSLAVGPAEDPATIIGPLVDEAAKAKVLEHIATAQREGRLALSIAPPSNLEGYFVGPVIVTDLAPSARTAQEEIFGPVLAVFRTRSFEEAIALANQTEYGLTGGLYSRNPRHIEYAERTWIIGNLYVNRKITGALVGRQPFGGIKLSGMGSKAGGPDYLKQFVWPMTVAENTLRHGAALPGTSRP